MKRVILGVCLGIFLAITACLLMVEQAAACAPPQLYRGPHLQNHLPSNSPTPEPECVRTSPSFQPGPACVRTIPTKFFVCPPLLCPVSPPPIQRSLLDSTLGEFARSVECVSPSASALVASIFKPAERRGWCGTTSRFGAGLVVLVVGAGMALRRSRPQA